MASYDLNDLDETERLLEYVEASSLDCLWNAKQNVIETDWMDSIKKRSTEKPGAVTLLANVWAFWAAFTTVAAALADAIIFVWFFDSIKKINFSF